MVGNLIRVAETHRVPESRYSTIDPTAANMSWLLSHIQDLQQSFTMLADHFETVQYESQEKCEAVLEENKILRQRVRALEKDKEHQKRHEQTR